MTIHIFRTRMAMDGEAYAYSGLVPVSDVDADRFSFFEIRDGMRYVPFVEATVSPEHEAMPTGWTRYQDWLAHEKRMKAELLKLAQSVYPELSGVSKWPTLWVDIPGFDQRHDVQVVEYAA